jgi:hypothetical protein
MIQRIQTVYMLLAALLGLLLLFLPLGVLPGAEGEGPDRVLASDSAMLLASGLLVFVFSLTAVFFYVRRPLQISLCYAAIGAVLLFCALVVVTLIGRIGSLAWTPGSFLPLAILLFLALAIRSIRKDERLVRSMDRFR